MSALLVAIALALQGPGEGAVLFHRRAPLVAERGYGLGDLFERVDNYIRNNFPQVEPPRIFTSPFAGEPALHWFAAYPGVEARLAFEAETRGDEGWRALESSLANLLGPGGSEEILFPLGGAGPGSYARPFRWVRVARAAQPEIDLARSFAGELADYLEATYEQVDARAYSADLHDPGAIYLMIDCEDLAAWQGVRAALLKDGEYLRRMERGRELFLEERVDETLLLDFQFDPGLVRPRLYAAVLKDHGRPAEAIPVYRQAIEQDPGSPVLQHNLGHALQDVGRYDEAAVAFRRRLELEPEESEGYADLGWLLYLQGDNEEARSVLEQGLAIAPDNGRALAILARVFWAQDDLAQAIGHARRALECKESEYILRTLVQLLTVEARALRPDPEEVVGLAERLVELDPQKGENMGLRGLALYRAGRVQEALDVLRASLQVEGGNEPVNYMALALALHAAGEPAEAARWRDRADQRMDEEGGGIFYELRLREDLERALAEQPR